LYHLILLALVRLKNILDEIFRKVGEYFDSSMCDFVVNGFPGFLAEAKRADCDFEKLVKDMSVFGHEQSRDSFSGTLE
jgi:hypothetical protein